MKTLATTLVLSILYCTSPAQSIVDPCFASIEYLGFFAGSDDIINLSRQEKKYLACDMLEWDGKKWVGEYPGMGLALVPPEGCNVHAVWMGYDWWTGGGEAIAMRLDKPLEVGKTYTYTFTYRSDGNGDLNNFSPIFYTDKSKPLLSTAYRVGRLPETDGWATNSFTFTATAIQRGHEWIILHAYESSGILLGNCEVNNPLPEKFLQGDTTICYGDTLTINALSNPYYSYAWSSGENTPSITVSQPDSYSVDITYYKCISSDTVVVNFEDCEVRLNMPNFFTPNGDAYNPIFEPIEFNYIQSGVLRIYNRWGNPIYTGDLFEGWNGTKSEKDASTGGYFYEVEFIDRTGKKHFKKGLLTLSR